MGCDFCIFGRVLLRLLEHLKIPLITVQEMSLPECKLTIKYIKKVFPQAGIDEAAANTLVARSGALTLVDHAVSICGVCSQRDRRTVPSMCTSTHARAHQMLLPFIRGEFELAVTCCRAWQAQLCNSFMLALLF